ncbi:MAG: pseudouridine synthase [Flavobacteriales bacterium]|nr:pseudouridine synthase [Flavobacteriales bacterium]
MDKEYHVLYKPFGILSQFSDEGKRSGLGSILDLPKDIYPVGRLDADSEGLLLLTNDKSLNDKLLNPRHAHRRTYMVQVEGDVTEDHLSQLCSPMELNYKGKIHVTRPSYAEYPDSLPDFPERIPPIRFRASIPTTWIQLTITEGKNRQVRKMTAKVGLPTLRLVRWSLEKLTVEGFSSGEIRSYSRNELFEKLFS